MPHQESVLHSVIIMLQELALPEVTLEYLTFWSEHLGMITENCI